MLIHTNRTIGLGNKIGIEILIRVSSIKIDVKVQEGVSRCHFRFLNLIGSFASVIYFLLLFVADKLTSNKITTKK